MRKQKNGAIVFTERYKYDRVVRYIRDNLTENYSDVITMDFELDGFKLKGIYIDGSFCYKQTEEFDAFCESKGINNVYRVLDKGFYARRLGVTNTDLVCLMNPFEKVTIYPSTARKIKKSNEFITLEKDVREKVEEEAGVELELESDASASFGLQRAMRAFFPNGTGVIQDIGSDGSVRGGCEIRFSHFPLKKWKIKEIEKVTSLAKKIGFESGPTAGMHVHISHPRAMYAASLIERDCDAVNEFLLPICCRERRGGNGFRYGLGTDIFRNQWTQFKTVELRCWASTTNPYLIYKRIAFTKMFVKFIVGNRGMKNVWTRIPNKMKKLYLELLNIDNNHEVGMPVEQVMEKLGVTNANSGSDIQETAK